MQIHYIRNYVYDNDLECLEYYSQDTLSSLNNYVDDNIDTSDWSCGDMVRVEMERYEKDSWEDNKGLFFWNGYRLIYPFYHGNLNDFGTVEYEVDTTIDIGGFVPNTFQALYDYSPQEPFDYTDGIKNNKVVFTDLSQYNSEISDNYVTFNVSNSQYDSENRLTISHFYHDGIKNFVMFYGNMRDEIMNYLCRNRPYDLDAEATLSEFDSSTNIYDVYEKYDSNSYDNYFFIHPKFLTIDFEAINQESPLQAWCNRTKSRSKHAKGVFYHNTPSNKYSTGSNKTQCISVTNKGKCCTRMAKSGHSYCGIHLQEGNFVQCSAYTAKGIRCGREARHGNDYCGIHI
jgi:hypothetical protein